MVMTLAQLCAPWSNLQVVTGGDVPIKAVIADSRQATAGAMFVATVGSGGDGHDFVAQAIAGGCSAVALIDDRSDCLPEICSSNVDFGLVTASNTVGLAGLLTRELYERPDEQLIVSAVTGTNGKTTVAFLLQQMLSVLSGRCGLIGTIKYDNGLDSRPAALTTPGGPELYSLLAEMVNNGCQAVALEASSHALAQKRTAGLAVDVAVFTNLGRDHLDYHGDLSSYLAAKSKLLNLVTDGPTRAKAPGAVVVNAADPAFINLVTNNLHTVCYDASGRIGVLGTNTADLILVSSELSLYQSKLEFVYQEKKYQLTSPLVGRFNVENLAAALATGLALGYDPESCTAALAKVTQVPGRVERIRLPNGALAVVDYAHTHDALAAVLGTCRELTKGRLILVFGCGGDRDPGKRPLMGAVAARAADQVWITSDNPRSEDPEVICAAISRGFSSESAPLATQHHVVIDRREAVCSALEAAGDGDIVVIAGKGHEDYQLIQ